MNQRSRFRWAWALGSLVIASIVGVGAYLAGHTTAVVMTNPAAGTVVYDGYGHDGFFPFFGFVWFLLIVFLLFGLFRRGWGRGHWGGGPYGGGYWHQHPHEHAGMTPPTPPPSGEPDQPKSA